MKIALGIAIGVNAPIWFLVAHLNFAPANKTNHEPLYPSASSPSALPATADSSPCAGDRGPVLVVLPPRVGPR